MGAKCVLVHAHLSNTDFCAFLLGGGGGEGVVWSQGLEYFIKSDWIKSHVCLEGKHLFLLPGRAEIVFV